MQIIKNYPNIIVFHHNDADGLAAAFIIKQKFDNNLINNNWERNVTCIPVSYGEKYNLDFFKEKTSENLSHDSQNIIYMVDYAIQPNNLMLNFWNWLSDKNCQFYWIDHHITAIENLKHLNIPGIQSSANAASTNTWNLIYNTKTPIAISIINEFDTWKKNSQFSWDKQIFPLIYFIEALGLDLNDNTNELVTAFSNMLIDNNQTNKYINIGKYIFKFIKNTFEKNKNKIYNKQWQDYNCLLLNSTHKGHLQFESFENYNDYDLLITWHFNGKKYVYSIYSDKANIHCGDICKTFLNGGGHKGAGGGESINFILNI